MVDKKSPTILSMIPTLLHHGMIVVGLPYSFQGQSRMDEISGCSPYGASTITKPDGSRMPSENELAGARFQGRHVAQIASKLKDATTFGAGTEGHSRPGRSRLKFRYLHSCSGCFRLEHCRVGFAPTGKRRLFSAHAKSGHLVDTRQSSCLKRSVRGLLGVCLCHRPTSLAQSISIAL